MTTSVDNNQSQNVFGKAVPSQISKGALIGAGVGAAVQGAWSGIVGKSLLTAPSKDEFLKQGIEEATKICKDKPKELFEKVVNDLKTNLDGNYERFLEHFKESKSEFFKQLPKAIGQSALIVGGIGAAIGGIVYLVKKAKAPKEANTQQANN